MSVNIESVVREWRIATVKACKYLNEDYTPYANVISSTWWKESVTKNFVHTTKNQIQAAYQDLTRICKQAAELAILFSGSSFEYEWEQDEKNLEGLAVVSKDHIIIGTEGPQPDEDNQIACDVFGGIVRGDKSTGLLENGRYRVPLSYVVIKDRKKWPSSIIR